VATALTFFVNYYTYLAAFKSVVDRLNSFDAAIEQAQALSDAGPARVASAGGAPGIDLEDVDLFLPDGRRIVETKHLVLASGESVALSGPSGSSKSTLFRAISGIWPYGEGRIRSPEGIHVMVVPPKPYIPIGTLRAAVTYPAVPGTYRDDDIRRALVDAHLGDLVDQLDHEDVWSQHLSSGEQQRVALARALLMRPDWLFLDESTSAVDEKLEAELYAVLAAEHDDHVHRPSLGSGRAPPAPPRNESGRRSLHVARCREGRSCGITGRQRRTTSHSSAAVQPIRVAPEPI
jgi:putative ATP-binding cassette transporter